MLYVSGAWNFINFQAMAVTLEINICNVREQRLQHVHSGSSFQRRKSLRMDNNICNIDQQVLQPATINMLPKKSKFSGTWKVGRLYI
jgi:hypothetical protein